MWYKRADCETGIVRFGGIRCHCLDVRQRASTDVTFVAPCECIAFHGVNRWVAKTDLSPVPSDRFAIQVITPSQIYAWEGLAPDVDMTDYTEARLPSEQKW